MSRRRRRGRVWPYVLLLLGLALFGACHRTPAAGPTVSPSPTPITVPPVPATSGPSLPQLTVTVPPASSAPTSGACRSGQVCASSWPVPRHNLTPGAVTPGCTYPRPASQRDVPFREKLDIASAYGIHDSWTNYEFDHLVPFADCGSNLADNVWPERYDGAPRSAFIHNRKDELEEVLTGRIRARPDMLGQVQQLYLGTPWPKLWCTYVHKPGVTCDV